MDGELYFNARSGAYEGYTEGVYCFLRVPTDAMATAQRLLLRGKSSENLQTIATWLRRPELLALPGVELQGARHAVRVAPLPARLPRGASGNEAPGVHG